MVHRLTSPAIGVVVAMELELVHLRRMASDHKIIRRRPFLTEELTLGTRRVVTVRSGIGLVDAAAATTSLLIGVQPNILLNFGCAGAHRRDLVPGDVVIGESYVNHGMVTIDHAGERHYAGFLNEPGSNQESIDEIKADPRLLSQAVEVAQASSIDPWPTAYRDRWPRISRNDPIAISGIVASADVWTQSAAMLDELHERHGSLCEDMEAVAIARVALKFGVPFLAIKDISNSEFLQPTDVESFNGFPFDEVGKRSARMIGNLVGTLSDYSSA